ncbi:MAG TPA: hypothetical protein VFN29_04825 [Chiayiivirga sp.]|nr:hypothetical protein [Chiayiivirga sp.]
MWLDRHHGAMDETPAQSSGKQIDVRHGFRESPPHPMALMLAVLRML